MGPLLSLASGKEATWPKIASRPRALSCVEKLGLKTCCKLSSFLHIIILHLGVVLGLPCLALCDHCLRLKTVVDAKIFAYPDTRLTGELEAGVGGNACEHVLLVLTFCIVGPEDALAKLEYIYIFIYLYI